MKRWIAAVLAAVFWIMPTQIVLGAEVSASCAVLMDGESGRVLYAKAAHEPRQIASTTKLMTALVALDTEHALDSDIVVAEQWTGVEGSSIYLRPGEHISLEELLYGMLLQSGNDAATAVAGVCGGTAEQFSELMNKKAAELGMENSHFSNPSGLSDEENYSTAYDMALLARACLGNKTLARIVSTKSATVNGKVFTNHNKLLWRYPGCIGLKTGFTEKAGRTLVSAAERDGRTLICVTLNAPNDWSDHTALLDWGFSAWKSCQLAAEGESLCRIPVEGALVPFCTVSAGASVQLCLKAGEKAEMDLQLVSESLTAPVVRGTVLGEAVYRVNGEELLRIPLTAGQNIERSICPPRGWERLWDRLTKGR